MKQIPEKTYLIGRCVRMALRDEYIEAIIEGDEM
jgi:hypothetical protein